MKDSMYGAIGALAIIGIILGLVYFLVYVNYGVAELDAFNRISGTAYTQDQWRVYEYDIKRLHPFVEPKMESVK